MSDEKPKRIEPFPQSDDRSLGYHAARTTIDAVGSLVPGAGYAVGELVRHFIGEPLERRREEWFTSIGEGILELQDRFDGFDPASLRGNDDFIGAVYEATQIALKTSKKEKREALRNAVLNAAKGTTIDEVLRGSFFGAIDRFSTLHIRVLRILANPRKSPDYMQAAQNVWMSSRDNVLSIVFAKEGISSDALQRVYSDLNREGMTDGAERGGVTGDEVLRGCATRVGYKFIDFVSNPLEV